MGSLGASSLGGEQRGPMSRAAVLEEMLRSLPPEVASQIEGLERQASAHRPSPTHLLEEGCDCELTSSSWVALADVI